MWKSLNEIRDQRVRASDVFASESFRSSLPRRVRCCCVVSRLLLRLIWMHRCPRAIGLKNETLRLCWINAGLLMDVLRKLHDLFCTQRTMRARVNYDGDNDANEDDNARDNSSGIHKKLWSSKQASVAIDLAERSSL